MTKEELIRHLEPFDDETQILVRDQYNQLQYIRKFTYNPSTKEEFAFLSLEL